MLDHLSISNLAIISHLEVEFRPGLNILSGETGAGKSIIINAVNLILGGRASGELIRSGAEEARVEALFVLPENSSMAALFDELGLPFQQEVVIKRTISREGRNRIMVNQSIASLNSLSRIGQSLISISGQHEHQFLLKPENHLYLLDDFGALSGRRLELNTLFGKYLSLKGEYQKLENEIRDGEARLELSRFQMEEIDKAEIKSKEDSSLEEEKRRLRNADFLSSIVKETYQVIYENDRAVLSEIGACLRRLEKGAEMDKGIRSLRDDLASMKLLMEEVAFKLGEMQARAPEDPRRLEQVEDRIQELNKLKKKYGSTLEEVLDFRKSLTVSMNDLDEKRDSLAGTRCALEEIEKEILGRAAELSRMRKRSARALEKAAMEELALLAMGGTRFEVRFGEEYEGQPESAESPMRGIKPDGLDRAEFMISTNVGEELKPLAKIASGGELSRIMLALKTILARRGSVETVIFDEVDAGIGGATAELVGEKLRSLAAYHQILCITHLPQIAGKGETHFLVKKQVVNKRTTTVISLLSQDERVEEIARLLGGKIVTESAKAHAREILAGCWS